MTIYELSNSLSDKNVDKLFSRIYGKSDMEKLRQRARYINSAECFSRLFPTHEDICVYSAPLPIKIGGNFLENSIYAGVSADIIAVVGFNNDGVIRIKSEKSELIVSKSDQFSTKKDDLMSRLIHKITDDLTKFSGFDAYISSDISDSAQISAVIPDTALTSDFDFSDSGYSLCTVKVCDEINRKSEIYNDMKIVAKTMDVEHLSDIKDEDFYNNIPELRGKCSDRAIMSAVYFFEENHRISKELEMLNIGRPDEFFPIFSCSGDAVVNLYNMYGDEEVPKILLGISASRRFLNGSGAVSFSDGLILAFVPDYMVNGYISELDRIFGEGSTNALIIRNGNVSKIFS